MDKVVENKPMNFEILDPAFGDKFGKWFDKELRKHNQLDFVKRTGVSRMQLYRIRTGGVTSTSIDTLARVLDGLGYGIKFELDK